MICMKCRETHEGEHECPPGADEEQVARLKEMIMMHLQPFVGKPVTPARVAALKITAQEVITKLDGEQLPPYAIREFTKIVAEEVAKIFGGGAA